MPASAATSGVARSGSRVALLAPATVHARSRRPFDDVGGAPAAEVVDRRELGERRSLAELHHNEMVVRLLELLRELKNEVFKLAALAPERIDARLLRNLGEGIRPPQMQLAGRTLEELEKEAIKQALIVARGKRVEAARLLGLPRRTFYNRLKRYGLL